MPKLTAEQIAKAQEIAEKLRNVVGENNYKSAQRVATWINSQKDKVVKLVRNSPINKPK